MTQKPLLLIWIALFSLWGCSQLNPKESNPENEFESGSQPVDTIETDWNYTEVHQSYFDSLPIDLCASPDVEFIDLYPTLDSITSMNSEHLVLVDLLKSKGFSITDNGQGNWMYGPRIVSFTMTDQHCECQVDKLYYSTVQEGSYRITERIKCKKLVELNN